MRPATMRVFWYVGLIFVAIGLSRISHSGVPEAFFSAVSVYIPASLLRLLLGRFIVEQEMIRTVFLASTAKNLTQCCFSEDVRWLRRFYALAKSSPLASRSPQRFVVSMGC
jgi:hypothetical protein